MLICVALWAAPKRRQWRDATVVKIEHSVMETDEQTFTQSPAPSSYPATPSGIAKSRKSIWTYALKTDLRVYVGRAGKPIVSVHEGDRIRLAVHNEALYVLIGDAKERKLELLKPE